MAKRVRWICPECGNGKLASTRPRKDATVRYCLRCSEKSGTLVQRTAPTLAAKRDRVVGRRKAKVQAKRVKLDALPWIKRNDLIEAELRWFKRVAIRIGYRAADYAYLDKIRRSKVRPGTSGRAWSARGRIVITIGTSADKARVCAVLAHEVVHVMLPNREHHGDLFRSGFIEMVREAYGVDVSGDFSSVYNTWSCEGLDGAVAKGIRKALDSTGNMTVLSG